jgi:hypothetical protein
MMTTTTVPELTTTKKLIRYPRFEELHEMIGECQVVSAESGEPLCLRLEGKTGTGKTTLVKSYARAFPRRYIDEKTRIPIFYMETPHPVTVKGMAAAMLETLGDPGAHKGTLWSMNSRLVNFIRDCGVRLVILDDFHHLVDRKTNRILREVSDWLKVLIKRTHIPFLVVGIDGEVERILKANQQLSRLFVREQLCPFAWEEGDPRTIEDFAAFIAYTEHTLDQQLSPNLPRAELLYRIHYATEGVIGYIMYLFDKAVRLARQQGSDELTLAMLAEAFEKRLRVHVNKTNPFIVPGHEPFATPLPVSSMPDAPDSISQRGNRRQPRQPTAGEILKAN